MNRPGMKKFFFNIFDVINELKAAVFFVLLTNSDTRRTTTSSRTATTVDPQRK